MGEDDGGMGMVMDRIVMERIQMRLKMEMGMMAEEKGKMVEEMGGMMNSKVVVLVLVLVERNLRRKGAGQKRTGEKGVMRIRRGKDKIPVTTQIPRRAGWEVLVLRKKGAAMTIKRENERTPPTWVVLLQANSSTREK
ncbi:hypothetical protein SMACR_09021 [Sordaria macrospora]|uniref:Uncharacterized protein n=1 Tax=Sordaria macrospora TaxID=5147 RepID=A0A8S9A5R8_SORMA|nr:hypothetical protein SMACR_09021 [Sordaria macrospora]WPJ66245.1 hypothetical protein SMAC4_09021 [Sordaria macrospora]